MVLTITKCFAKDCKNIRKIDLICTVNHELSKGRCLQYEFDVEYFNITLKEYLNNKDEIRGIKDRKYYSKNIETLNELDNIIDEQKIKEDCK